MAQARLRRRAVLAMTGGVMALAGMAGAQAPAGPFVDLAVVDRATGQVLPAWRHDGRLFVAGRPGARYALRVTNNSAGRVLVVMSVDGVNVLTGETAGYGQRGYVFDAYQSYDVTGWRKSDSEVAAFTFAPISRSYAARTGRPADVGVIGIAAFQERPPPPPIPYEVEESVVGRAQPAAPAPPAAAERRAPADSASRGFAAAEPPSAKLGTGHGAREWSAVTRTPFVRLTSYPQLVRRIEYDSYENLVAMGVVPRSWDRSRGPRPFPGEGYVPDPPGGA